MLVAAALAAALVLAEPPPEPTPPSVDAPTTPAAPETPSEEEVDAPSDAPAPAMPPPPASPPAMAATVTPSAAPKSARTKAPPERPRVFVAPISGEATEPEVRRLIEERILVAARAFASSYDVLGANDVRGVLDAEATQLALGCETTTCMSEIADALAAEQLVSGQLGRIGNTWQLSLTRTERAELRVVARSTIEARGDTPEGLLPKIDEQVRELFGAPVVERTSWLSTAGMWLTLSGGVVGVAALSSWGGSWLLYSGAKSALEEQPQKVDDARNAARVGEGLYTVSLVGAAGAGLICAVGGGLWIVGALGVGAE